MNATPHQHQPHIERDGANDENWVVRYGDTNVRFAWFFQKPYRWPKEKQDRVITAALVKAIKKHDLGTQREAIKREPVNWRLNVANEIANRLFPNYLSPSTWASEHLWVEAVKEQAEARLNG